MAERGIDLPGWTPQRLATVLENLARSFLFGTNFAIPAHVETQAFVTDWLAQLFTRRSD